MLVKLIEVYSKNTYASNADGEVFVNPEHVVCMRENDNLKTRLSETPLGQEIHSAEGFTKLYINRGQSGLDLDVVGDLGETHTSFTQYQNALTAQWLRNFCENNSTSLL
jgi:hypothetical protein